jgi:protein-disulfide isomerase
MPETEVGMTRDRSVLKTTPRCLARNRSLGAGCLLLAATFVAGGLNSAGCGTTVPISGTPSTGSNIDDSVARPVILESDHVLGEATAPLTIVEYESYQTAACGRFARTEFPTIKQQYIDTGQVRWVFRHFPLTSQTNARAAATAAECAGDQDKFLEYRDEIYGTPDADGNAVLTDAQLKTDADTVGLDRTTFDDCLAGDTKDARIDQDVNSGTALGVTSLPAFIVDNQLIQGFTTAADLSKTINRHLAGTQ